MGCAPFGPGIPFSVSGTSVQHSEKNAAMPVTMAPPYRNSVALGSL
jgi:hypothetical protein